MSPGRLIRRLRKRPRPSGDGGFTLIELMAATALSLLIGSAALGLLDAVAPLSNSEFMRQDAISEGRAGLETMVRELRGADSINSTSGTFLDFNATTPSGQQRIVYSCDDSSQVPGLSRCTRYSGAVGGPVGNGKVIIDRLVNGTTSQPVFRYLPSRIRPTEIKVQVVLPSRAESPVGYNHRVVINDSAFIRNVDLTGT